MNQCQIIKLGPVQIFNTKKRILEQYPNWLLFKNIVTLRNILDLIDGEWEKIKEKYDEKLLKIAAGNENDNAIFYWLMDVTTPFLKCFFSYIFFFRALDNAYDSFYKELNRFNNNTKVKHGKRPKKSIIITKVISIRNSALAHMGEKTDIDSIALMNWNPSLQVIDDKLKLDGLTFGATRIIAKTDSIKEIISSDMSITFIDTIKNCIEYIDSYDQVCAQYLTDLLLYWNNKGNKR